MRRIFAIARKEFTHVVRDPRLLTAVLVMPLLQLFLFAYALSFDVRDIPTVVLDSDNTAASRRFVDTLRQSGYFRVVGALGSVGEADEAFLSGRARAVVIVQPGFQQKVIEGRKGQVAVLLDGSEPNSAQLGRGYAIGLGTWADTRLTFRGARRAGLDPGARGRIEPHLRIWYNPEAISSNFLIPGLIVVIVMIVMVQQTALTLVKEKDQGTLEQLIVSPVRRGELMLGKVAPWVAIAAADFIILTIAGLVAFGVPFRGDVLLLAGSSALFVLSCLSIGLLVSARASSPETANQVALIISFLPGFMLSDFVFPLKSLPIVLQWLSYAFPARYMVAVSRGVFLKGAGFDILWPQIASLAVYAIVALTVTSLFYRRRI